MAEDFTFDLYKDRPVNPVYPVYEHLSLTIEELFQQGVTCLLFLDFDGVVNIIPKFATYHPGNASTEGLKKELEATINYNYYPVDNFQEVRNVHYEPPGAWAHSTSPTHHDVRWSSEMVEHLNRICSSPTVQTIMVSTWRQWAREPLDMMGFKPAREVLNLQWGSDNPKLGLYYDQRWKPVGLNNYLSRSKIPAGMKMAWIDDEILKNQNRHYLGGLPKPFFGEDISLLVAPKENYGISRKEMDMLERFVSGKQ